MSQAYEYPEPFGLGNPGKLRDYIGKLRKHGRPTLAEKGSNTNLLRGDNKPDILARLARDHPDILLDYQQGKDL